MPNPISYYFAKHSYVHKRLFPQWANNFTLSKFFTQVQLNHIFIGTRFRCVPLVSMLGNYAFFFSPRLTYFSTLRWTFEFFVIHSIVNTFCILFINDFSCIMCCSSICPLTLEKVLNLAEGFWVWGAARSSAVLSPRLPWRWQRWKTCLYWEAGQSWA